MKIRERTISHKYFKNLEPVRKYLGIYDEGDSVVLMYRDEPNEKTYLTIKEYPWYFCIEKDNLEKKKEAKKIKSLMKENLITRITKDGDYIKLYCRNLNRRNVLDGKREVIRELEGIGIKTFEADLSSSQRCLIDNKLNIEDQYQILYFDIETDDRNEGIEIGRDRILSIAFCNLSGRTYYYTGDERTILKKSFALIDKYDLIIGWNCLVGNTKILTPLGYKEIKDVKVNDTILGYKNKKIVKTKVKNVRNVSTKLTYKIITPTGKIECTSKHRLFVWRPPMKYAARFKYQQVFSFNEIKEIQAKDIQQGDYLLTPQQTDFLTEEITNLKRGDCYLAGFSITDGTIPVKGRRIIFYNSRNDILNWISNYLKRPITGSILKSGEMIKRRVRTTNQNEDVHKVIRDILKMPCSPHLNCKWDFSIIKKLQKRLIYSFLAGMIDGDGSVSKGSVNICQKNHALFHALRPILLALGLKTTISGHRIRMTTDSPKAKEVLLQIRKEMKHTVKREKLLKIFARTTNVQKAPVCECFFLTRIVKIEKRKKKQRVYDIETGTHNFIAEGHLSHNSQGFDEPYMRARAKDHRVWYNWKRILHVDLMQKMMEINKRNVALIKKVRSFALNAVAKEFIGEQKIAREGVYEMFENDPEKLKRYNIQDVILVKKLDAKLKIMRQKIVEHQITGCFLNEYAISRILDIYVLRSAPKGIRFQSKPPYSKDNYDKKESGYSGGAVLEPVAGLHDQVYHFDFSCLEENTLITTVNGLKKIKNIKTGDKIFNKQGIDTVTDVRTKEVQTLLKIRTNQGDEILATPEHRFPTDKQVKHARDLKTGDCLQTNCKVNLQSKHTQKEKDYACFAGICYAEGGMLVNYKSSYFAKSRQKLKTSRIYRLSFRLSLHEKKFQQICLKLMKSLWNIKPSIYYGKESNGPKYSITKKKIVLEFQEYMSRIEKTLLDKELAIEFLRGFFEGDGSYNIRRNYIQLNKSKKHYKKMLFVRSLLSNLEINSSLSSLQQSISSEGGYLLTIKDVIKFEKEIGFLTKDKVRKLRLKEYSHRAGLIVSIKEIKKQATVYDLTIEKNPYFIANNILTHNSLYPSIIRTWNISPETYLGDHSRCKEISTETKEIILTPNKQSFLSHQGIIPKTIQGLLDARNKIRHEDMKGMKENDPDYEELYFKQYAFKTMSNSFYGILGASFTRYYKKENAEAITLSGQYLIHLVVKYFELEGMNVLAGDTDSVFINGKEIDAEEFHLKINTFISYHLFKEFNVRHSYIDLKVEAVYDSVLLMNVKKRYVKNHHGELAIVGLEARRRETIPLAAKMQTEMLEKILLKKASLNTMIDWVLDFKEQVIKGELSGEEVTAQIKLSKNVDLYDKKIYDEDEELIEVKESKLPHIKVAKWLKERHIQEGGRNTWEKGAYVKYIVTSKIRGQGINAVSPLNYEEGDYDIAYYWNTKFYAMLERVLVVVFPKHDWKQYEIDTKVSRTKKTKEQKIQLKRRRRSRKINRRKSNNAFSF